MVARRTRVALPALIGGVVGVAGAWHAWLGVAVIAAAVGGAALVRLAPSPSRLFLGVLGGSLIGYAFLGRGFAYMGVAPIYVGELTLLIGIAAVLLDRRGATAFHSPVVLLVTAFGVWGAVRTAPFVGAYGVDALRDAVVWGYGAFVPLVAAVLMTRARMTRVPEWFGRVLPAFLLWVPIAAVLWYSPTYDMLPRIGPDATIPTFKSGDAAVHLAGAAAFLLLAPRRRRTAADAWPVVGREWLWWSVIAVDLIIVASTTRGGSLAVFVAVAVVALGWRARAGRKAAWLGGLTTAVALLMLVADVSWSRDSGRDVSARQVLANLSSVIGDGDADQHALQSTREWRLQWWRTIADYTVFGPYFWTGKGFGVNLADDDGFQTDDTLRSPHSIHMTVLARMGVPGIVLWVTIQLVFGGGLVRAYFRARRAGADWWACVDLWLLAYWLAFLVNASFDVYLEGPPGGIPFWTLLGAGAAVLTAQRDPNVFAAPRRTTVTARVIEPVSDGGLPPALSA